MKKCSWLLTNKGDGENCLILQLFYNILLAEPKIERFTKNSDKN